MPPTKVKFFTSDGKVALVNQWLLTMPLKVQAKGFALIIRLSELGYDLRRPEADYLEQGIYELRWREGSVNYRILYFFHGRDLVVLAHALTKRDQIPLKDLKLTIERKRLFEQDPKFYTYPEKISNES